MLARTNLNAHVVLRRPFRHVVRAALWILAIRYSNEPVLLAAFAALAVLPVLWLAFVAVLPPRFKPPNLITLTEVDISPSSDDLSYVSAYLIPFLGLDLTEPRNLVSLSLVFVVLAAIYVRSIAVFTNPTAALFGRSVVLVRDGTGRQSALLARHETFRAGQVLKVHLLVPGVFTTA